MNQRMDPEIKARWVEALRSGQYEQGAGHLRVDGPAENLSKFCCLGVLCELAVEDGVVSLSLEPYEDGVRSYGILVDGRWTQEDDNVLPKPVAEWAKIDHEGYLPRDGERQCPDVDDGEACESALCAACNSIELTELNDNGAYNFTDIAGVIEKWF